MSDLSNLKPLDGGTQAQAMSSPPGDGAAPMPIAPDPYDINNPKVVSDVKKRLDERWKVANYRRHLFELKWLRNILYWNGKHNIRIDYNSKTIRNLSFAPNFPRAITNKYAQVMGDRWASLIQGDVPVNFTPATDDTSAVASALVCERVQEVIDYEVKTRTLKRDLGFWVNLTGNGFIQPYYDYSDEHGTTPVGMQQCDGCSQAGAGSPFMPGAPGSPDTTQSCPECSDAANALGQPPPPPSYTPASNPDGSPMTQSLPVGKLCHDVLSPFEVYKDNAIRAGTMKDTWYFTFRRYDISTAQKLWPDAKITETMTEKFKPTRNYLLAIAYSGSYLNGSTGIYGEAGTRDELKRQVCAWVYREMPTVEYPEGLYVTWLGEEPVEIKTLPDKWGAGRLAGQPFLGLVHFMDGVSGGAWAKPVADDLVDLQSRRNNIESNLQLTMQRVGAPKLLDPIGSKMMNVTGESGQIIKYSPVVFGGTVAAEPHYLEGATGSLGPFLEHIKSIDDSMERLGGTFFLAGGDAPSGVTAASALAYLGERSNRALAPGKEQWAEGYAELYQYDLELIRKHWTDERILAILGTNKEWEYIKFKNSDLTGAVTVRIDYEALFPKSQATKRADLMQLSQMGLINPGDQEQVFEIYMDFGASQLKPGVEIPLAQAKREWDLFINDPTSTQPAVPPVPGQPPAPEPTGYMPTLIPGIQNSEIHLTQHKKDAQTQEFDRLYATNQPRAQMWINHILSTQADVMAQQAMLAPPGPAGPQHGAPPPAGGHAGSQHGSQHGAAGSNAQPAPIRKGIAAAQKGAGPAAPPQEAVPTGSMSPH